MNQLIQILFMALSSQNRGMLEQIIDREIGYVETLMRTFQDPQIKSQLHITKEEDFVLGMAWGYIMGKFDASFLAVNQRSSNTEESEEVINIILNRVREIKEAIFKSG
jgi:hypothetical protein